MLFKQLHNPHEITKSSISRGNVMLTTKFFSEHIMGSLVIIVTSGWLIMKIAKPPTLIHYQIFQMYSITHSIDTSNQPLLE